MKHRELVVTNGRAVFYASMWPELKDAALDCGWALGLHGSLNSDMDIMAMPWVEDAKPVEEMLAALEKCFTIPEGRHTPIKKTTDKPNGRVVYTLHIFADFYLDINIIDLNQAKAEAWDDGFDEGVAHENERNLSQDVNLHRNPNPYRKETQP